MQFVSKSVLYTQTDTHTRRALNFLYSSYVNITSFVSVLTMSLYALVYPVCSQPCVALLSPSYRLGSHGSETLVDEGYLARNP